MEICTEEDERERLWIERGRERSEREERKESVKKERERGNFAVFAPCPAGQAVRMWPITSHVKRRTCEGIPTGIHTCLSACLILQSG